MGYLPRGLPLPLVIPTNAGFWEAAAHDRLDVQQCVDCDTHRYPPTEGCYACSSLAWKWDSLPGTGSVFSYTWVHHSPHEMFAPAVPYNVAVVELDGAKGEFPVRMISNVVDAEEETLRIGVIVRLACEPRTEHIGIPRFRLDRGPEGSSGA